MRLFFALSLVALGTGCWSRQTVPVTPPAPRLVWVFEAPQPGAVIGSPCVGPEAVYLATAQARGINWSGTVFAVDPTTGKKRWVFDRDGWMLPSASTPLLSSGRLFVGEGMHGHFDCRLQCLDPATGHLVWEFPTGDHIEGGPVAAGELVVFPAGNDGMCAVDAATGKQRWAFRGDGHIDSTPCVHDGHVFVGAGKSRRFQNYQVICLDAATGKPVWRTPVPLPAWGNPVVAGGRVYIGLGNGRLTEDVKPPEQPAGALVCLDAANGKILWSFKTANAVFGRPTVVADRIVFGSRDGNLYALTTDGNEAYRVAMGGPVVAGVEPAGGRVYAVSVDGRIACVDPATGTEVWRHELARPGVVPQAFSGPVVSARRLYVAAEMTTGGNGIVTLFCFDLPDGEGGDA
jgi:outer membrane protein assembly factor BamB